MLCSYSKLTVHYWKIHAFTESNAHVCNIMSAPVAISLRLNSVTYLGDHMPARKRKAML
jgi:hypothetical protein